MAGPLELGQILVVPHDGAQTPEVDASVVVGVHRALAPELGDLGATTEGTEPEAPLVVHAPLAQPAQEVERATDDERQERETQADLQDDDAGGREPAARLDERAPADRAGLGVVHGDRGGLRGGRGRGLLGDGRGAEVQVQIGVRQVAHDGGAAGRGGVDREVRGRGGGQGRGARRDERGRGGLGVDVGVADGQHESEQDAADERAHGVSSFRTVELRPPTLAGRRLMAAFPRFTSRTI